MPPPNRQVGSVASQPASKRGSGVPCCPGAETPVSRPAGPRRRNRMCPHPASVSCREIAVDHPRGTKHAAGPLRLEPACGRSQLRARLSTRSLPRLDVFGVDFAGLTPFHPRFARIPASCGAQPQRAPRDVPREASGAETVGSGLVERALRRYAGSAWEALIQRTDPPQQLHPYVGIISSRTAGRIGAIQTGGRWTRRRGARQT